MSSTNISPKQVALAILFLIVIAMGLGFGIINFFDKGVDIDTLKERVGFLGIGLVIAGIAGLISLKD